MTTTAFPRVALVLALLGAACGAAPEPEAPSNARAGSSSSSSGGKAGNGQGGGAGARKGGAPGSDSTGGNSGTGGNGTAGGGGTAGSGTGGQAGGGGSAGNPTPGAGGQTGAGGGATPAPGDASASDTATVAPSPSPAGQGPAALGKIVFSQDFEKDMVGMNRGPKSVPPERVVMVDDPLGMRGKVLKVIFEKGDNNRTSPGTEPRTWVSNRPNGYEFAPGTKVSHAFGVMVESTNMNYCFAQVISTGGPVWMLIGGGDGKLTVFCNACGDANTTHFQIEPNKWHDFRVDMDFRGGGAVQFFHNGTMFRQSTLANTRGGMGHWDGGIYNRPAGTGGPTRAIYISNLSAGER